MNGTNLVWWAEHLEHSYVQPLLVQAAEEHPKGFTNAEEIGSQWYATLDTRGYNALCPYARNYLAHVYLNTHPSQQPVGVRHVQRTGSD